MGLDPQCLYAREHRHRMASDLETIRVERNGVKCVATNKMLGWIDMGDGEVDHLPTVRQLGELEQLGHDLRRLADKPLEAQLQIVLGG